MLTTNVHVFGSWKAEPLHAVHAENYKSRLFTVRENTCPTTCLALNKTESFEILNYQMISTVNYIFIKRYCCILVPSAHFFKVNAL